MENKQQIKIINDESEISKEFLEFCFSEYGANYKIKEIQIEPPKVKGYLSEVRRIKIQYEEEQKDAPP